MARQSVTWLSLCTGGSLTRTVVHFFPSSGGVSAPYPAHCKLTLVGLGPEPKSVLIEGARLSQPDGVWIDDAFPGLRETGGVFALFVEISTPQPRTDIEPSGVIVEFHSGFQVSRFSPLRLTPEGATETRGAIPYIKDGFMNASCVLANGSDQPVMFPMKLKIARKDRSTVESKISGEALAPFSVREFQIAPQLLDEIVPHQAGWGLVRLATLALDDALPVGCAAFVLFRDAGNQHLLSVSAL